MHIQMYKDRETEKDPVIVFLSREAYLSVIKGAVATFAIDDNLLRELQSNVIEEGDVMLILNGGIVRRALRDKWTFDKIELYHAIRESCVFEINHACDTYKSEPTATLIEASLARWTAYKKERGM